MGVRRRRAGSWMRLCAACGLALCVAAGAAAAQQGAGPSRADLRAYAGVAWSSPWLEAAGTRFSIGWNPIFGGSGTLWWSPRFGARLHLGYMPSGMPQPDGSAELEIEDRRLHNWLYDLSLAFRPFAGAAAPGGPLSSLYLFLGGGGFTANPDGGDPQGCVSPYFHGEACLSNDWRVGTVGQATAGGGLTLVPLSQAVGLFVETAVHFHASPFHVGPEWTGFTVCPECRAEDRWVVTPRLVGGLALALGAPPARLPPLPPPPPPPAAPPPPEERPIQLCVVVDGIPRYVQAFVRPATGDTVVIAEAGIRRPLRAAYPAAPAVASDRDWFVRDESIFLDGQEYVRFGVPRELRPEELVRRGDYRGVPLFEAAAAVPAPGEPAAVYVPVGDGCIFQPYRPLERVRRVRG